MENTRREYYSQTNLLTPGANHLHLPLVSKCRYTAVWRKTNQLHLSLLSKLPLLTTVTLERAKMLLETHPSQTQSPKDLVLLILNVIVRAALWRTSCLYLEDKAETS